MGTNGTLAQISIYTDCTNLHRFLQLILFGFDICLAAKLGDIRRAIAAFHEHYGEKKM
jgi:hypothetical protein